jgi:DNA-damage-inducible protein J
LGLGRLKFAICSLIALQLLQEDMAMRKTETVRARIEPEIKRGAEAVLKKIGLTSSEAITLFLTQVKLTKGLPFPLLIPNKQTKRAINEAQSRKNVETFDSVSAWAKKMRSL